jgi:hypothetical protein
MEEFQVAHIREQGVDLVIIFVSESFGTKSDTEKARVAAALQICATAAGLAGNVVLVWSGSFGKVEFWAPLNQHAFFKTVSYAQLLTSINRTLTCG